MRYYMGVDCGLTAIKAALFDEAGVKHAQASRPTPRADHRLDATALGARMLECLREVLAESGVLARSVCGLGLSGHGNGLYALDAQGNVLASLSSMFEPGAADTAAFIRGESYPRFTALTRQTAWSGQPMQILRWMKRHEPDRYATIRHVLLCKDYLRWLLTGEIATDQTDAWAAALSTDLGGTGDAALYRLLGIEEMCGRVPGALPSTARAGALSVAAAAATGLPEGLPVSTGCFDVVACMAGGGVIRPGCYSITAGTWGITAAVLDAPVALGSLTQCVRFVHPDRHVAIVSAPTSCVNLDWFVRAVRPEMSLEEANRVAEAFAPGDLRLLYLPFLHQDLARPGVPAGFLGLEPRHTWREMLRAVYEGVAFAHRMQLDRLCESGIAHGEAVLSGGASNGALWRRMFADVLGVRVRVNRERESGALGAAMTAAVASGAYDGIDEAADRMVQEEAIIEPMPHDAYEWKYRQFKRLAGDMMWTMD